MRIELFGNVDGSVYKRTEIDLFEIAKKQEAQGRSNKLFMQENHIKNGTLESSIDDIPEVKVSISNQGLRALHGTKLLGSSDIEEIEKQKEFIANHQPVMGFYNSMWLDLQAACHETNEYGGSDYKKISFEEKADVVCKSYRSLSNEIISGYSEGKRFRFVNDENSEDGYRRISQKEEEQLLLNDFERFLADRFSDDEQKVIYTMLGIKKAYKK